MSGTGGNSEFDDFVNSGEVEVGDSNLASQADGDANTDADQTKNRQQRRAERAKGGKEPAAKAPAAAEGDDASDEGDEGDDAGDDEDDDAGDDEDDEDQKRESHLKRLKRERAEAKKEARELKARLAALDNGGLLARLEALEKGGLQNGKTGGNSQDQGKPAPDPTDADKYPLGHLDDRYIEDKLEWLADKKATERADAVLQRQQEGEQNAAAQARTQQILEQVDDLAERGADISDDYQELVVDTGLKGEWDLTQTTFEACHEAEHGAQILFDLSQDKKEATRVAKLPHLQQLKYVEEKNAEIAKKVTPRRIPRAGEPPQNSTRGTNSRTQIKADTDNLDDFEKLVEADAKKRH